jgi:arylsulfatase A
MKYSVLLNLSLVIISFTFFVGCKTEQKQVENSTPNIVIIFADDMGYGDISSYGHPTIKTPNLDQLAYEGQKWTNFYAPSSVCTPSRAGLLTGRLPIRSGMCGSGPRVIFPDSKGGLPQYEITIAKALKQKKYHTACIGKWHLGHLKGYQPLDHGFDYYYGIPYSNDMDRIEDINHRQACFNPKIEFFNVPLMRNSEIIERPANQTTITQRYTYEAMNFIKKNKNEPFFIYLAHSMPHVPLFASEDFKDNSTRGIYGDVIEEIDWGVGEILKTLKEEGLDKNTLIVFTSDNGPWLVFEDKGGSAGLLREGKGTSYEGGMKVPAIFWWPGKIKPAIIHEIGSALDLFPTINMIAGIEIPEDRIYDGFNISPVLFNLEKSKRQNIFYYHGQEVFAIRNGKWKIHYKTWENAYTNKRKIVEHNPVMLFNLDIDPSEKYDISLANPDIVKSFDVILESHLENIISVENQLYKR